LAGLEPLLDVEEIGEIWGFLAVRFSAPFAFKKEI
jgi:hypothetical protein